MQLPRPEVRGELAGIDPLLQLVGPAAPKECGSAPRCEVGDTGTLALTDSSKKLSNGERADKAEFVRISGAGLRESHVHDVVITREAPNYRAE